jgi:hypothetical protein
MCLENMANEYHHSSMDSAAVEVNNTPMEGAKYATILLASGDVFAEMRGFGDFSAQVLLDDAVMLRRLGKP